MSLRTPEEILAEINQLEAQLWEATDLAELDRINAAMAALTAEYNNSFINPIPEDSMEGQEAIVGTVQALEMKLDTVFQELTGTHGRYAAFAYAELLHGEPVAIFSNKAEMDSWLSLIQSNAAQVD